jgi:hypothetical protein
MPVTYSSGFIGDFKLGDNIVHNLAILRELYKTQVSSENDGVHLLCKPIVVLIGSVAEAVLYDLYVVKIADFTSEGVPNIDTNMLEEIRTKTIDEFAKYISHARSKSLLGGASDLYDSLEDLRKLRNRVHIQNGTRQRAAEKTLERLIDYMSRTHMRSASKKFVADFVLPWNSQLDACGESGIVA